MSLARWRRRCHGRLQSGVRSRQPTLQSDNGPGGDGQPLRPGLLSAVKAVRRHRTEQDIVASPGRGIMAPGPGRQHNMRRRHFLYGAASALAAPAVHAQSSREKMLKLVPLTSLYSLDTIFNT